MSRGTSSAGPGSGSLLRGSSGKKKKEGLKVSFEGDGEVPREQGLVAGERIPVGQESNNGWQAVVRDRVLQRRAGGGIERHS